MSAASRLVPAGPGEPQEDVFPLRERLRFRDSFGYALLELRARNVAFQGLAKGPWALFIGIAVHWQGNAEAWPGQDTLARFSGWSTRAVRDHADLLERCGFLRLRRQRRADGSERIFYAPGAVTLAALADFVERFPRDRPKPLRPAELKRPVGGPLAPPTAAHPSEAAAATPPEAASEERRDQDQIKPSSFCEKAPKANAESASREEQQVVCTKEDQELGRRALAERMLRKHPERRAPTWFDAGEVAMVAACVAAIDGDAESKMQAQRDAIAGAFIASKEGPPTVRFVWEKLDHFFDHVERGRRRRLADRPETKSRAEATEIPQSRMERPPGGSVPPEQIAADLERIFGPGWRRRGRTPLS